MNNLKNTFRAFKYRNYRLFFFGQGLSTIGTLMQQMAQGWLVYRITNSPSMLGLVAFAGQIPSIVFTPFAGVLSDRHDRRRILLIIDIIQMLQAFAMAALILTGVIQAWHIIILSILLGAAGAFEMTTRHSLVPQMVENKEDLSNAIALNSVMFNSARLIGPALAGVIVAWVGEGLCFLINGFSFIAVLCALLLMKIEHPVRIGHANPLIELKTGFTYAFKSFPLRIIILLMAFVSLTGSGVIVLLPVFAKDILHEGPQAYGFLIGSVGLGAIFGALYMASRKSVRGLSGVILIALFLFGTGIIAASFSKNLHFALVCFVFGGMGTMMHMAASNTIIQTITDDDKRGRVMSLYILAFSGFVPLGNLIAGYAAHTIGVRLVIAVGGCLVLLAALFFLFFRQGIRGHLKQAYSKKEI